MLINQLVAIGMEIILQAYKEEKHCILYKMQLMTLILDMVNSINVMLHLINYYINKKQRKGAKQ